MPTYNTIDDRVSSSAWMADIRNPSEIPNIAAKIQGQPTGIFMVFTVPEPESYALCYRLYILYHKKSSFY